MLQLRRLEINYLLSRTARLLGSEILPYYTLTYYPHLKSLLRILKFKNMKNIALQLSTKPVNTNISCVSREPKCAALRAPVTPKAFLATYQKLKAKVFFSSGHEPPNYERCDWGFYPQSLKFNLLFLSPYF